MNTKVFATLAIPVAILFSQTAFADSEEIIVYELNQAVAAQITESELLASGEDYVLEQAIRPKSRRSALFAHILDTMAKNATMAKADIVSGTQES